MKRLVVIILTLSVFVLMCTKSTEPENSPPHEPGNPVPANGATNQPLSAVLQWSGGDPDSDPVQYDVYFGTNASPPLVSSNQYGRNYIPDLLDYNTQYFWKIVAEDDHDHVTEGSTWNFTTGNTPPAPVNLTMQADGEGDGVVLAWEVVGTIDSLRLVLPDSVAVVTLNVSDTLYLDDTPSQTGDYNLYAVYSDNLSAPATVRSAAVGSASDVMLYLRDGPGGYGWDTASGEGEVYFLDGGHTSVTDFYFTEDTLMRYLRSCDQPPYNGNKRTDILDMGTTSFFTAPLAGYGTEAMVVDGNYFAMHVQDDYYAKVFVVSSDSTTMTFRCWFQTVQSLRIF